LESRGILTTTQRNDYLEFPFVGQAFAIERLRIDKKAGETSTEVFWGLTDHGTLPKLRLALHNRAQVRLAVQPLGGVPQPAARTATPGPGPTVSTTLDLIPPRLLLPPTAAAMSIPGQSGHPFRSKAATDSD
jgi:hypothetical protein